MIKLALLDVDGTITDPGRLISTRVIEAIRKVQKEGIFVSLVSGNVVPVLYGLKIFIGITAPVFGENGGAMMDRDLTAFFSKDKPLALFNKLSADGLVEGIVSNQWRVSSMGFSMQRENVEEVRKRSNAAELDIVDSGYSWHLLNKGQNKGFALDYLKGKYALNYSEILVMGDSFNDISMFRKEVVKAVPANAEEDLKDIADYISTEKDGNGAAEILLKLGKL